MNIDIALVIVIALGVVFWLLNRREEKKRAHRNDVKPSTINNCEDEEPCPMVARQQQACYMGLFSEDD